jgi:Sigma-70 factor, region 1.2
VPPASVPYIAQSASGDKPIARRDGYARSVLGELTFSDVIDWLAEREGASAHIEAGMSDPALEGSDFCMLALHVRLGKLQIVEDVGHERGMVSLPLEGFETVSGRPGSPPEHGAEDDARRYLRSIGRVPLLTRQDEVRLAKRIEGNDTAAKTSLGEANLCTRRGANKATIAVCHSILTAAWHMLQTGETYTDPGGDFFARRDPARTRKRLVGQLERLGYTVTLQEGAAPG